MTLFYPARHKATRSLYFPVAKISCFTVVMYYLFNCMKMFRNIFEIRCKEILEIQVCQITYLNTLFGSMHLQSTQLAWSGLDYYCGHCKRKGSLSYVDHPTSDTSIASVSNYIF